MSTTPACQLTVFGEVRLQWDERQNIILTPHQVTMLACLGIYAAAYPQKTLTRKLFGQIAWHGQFDQLDGPTDNTYRVACHRLNDKVLNSYGIYPLLLDKTQKTICLDLSVIQVDAVVFRAAYNSYMRTQSTSEKMEILYQAVAISDGNLAGDEIRDPDFMNARRILLEMKGDALYHLAQCLKEVGEIEEAIRYAHQALPFHIAKAQVLISQLTEILQTSVVSPETKYSFQHPKILLSQFFGRDAESQQLVTWLQPNVPTVVVSSDGVNNSAQRRLITLTGPGGSGKTRLAFHVANLLRGAFEKVLIIVLADKRTPDEVWQAIAKAADIEILPKAALQEQIFYILADKHILFVLDNFDQLVESTGFEVGEFLERCPYITCLITSRQSLNINGNNFFLSIHYLSQIRTATTEQLRTVRAFNCLWTEHKKQIQPLN